AELTGLLDLIRGFDRLLSAEPSAGDLVQSLRLVRGRVGPAEARIARLAGRPELVRRWREVRQRIDALMDDFDLPRVISIAAASRPARRGDRRPRGPGGRASAAPGKVPVDGGGGGPGRPQGAPVPRRGRARGGGT